MAKVNIEMDTQDLMDFFARYESLVEVETALRNTVLCIEADWHKAYGKAKYPPTYNSEDLLRMLGEPVVAEKMRKEFDAAWDEEVEHEGA